MNLAAVQHIQNVFHNCLKRHKSEIPVMLATLRIVIFFLFLRTVSFIQFTFSCLLPFDNVLRIRRLAEVTPRKSLCSYPLSALQKLPQCFKSFRNIFPSLKESFNADMLFYKVTIF